MRIAIAGASGRMGRILIETILKTTDLSLAAALCRKEDPLIGQDATAFLGHQSGRMISDRLDTLEQADCLIDFTQPQALFKHLEACVKYQVKMVIGTTGFTEEQRSLIDAAAQKIAILWAPNMSIGVNATFKLLELAAAMLQSGYDAEIFEAHHHQKVDAPSGTAIRMGEAIAKAWNVKLAEVATWMRQGNTGPRQPGSIGFSVLRGGDIVGEHTAYFCGMGERIEITHRSNSRVHYAEGSFQAARFLQDKPPGLYDMQAVLGY